MWRGLLEDTRRWADILVGFQEAVEGRGAKGRSKEARRAGVQARPAEVAPGAGATPKEQEEAAVQGYLERVEPRRKWVSQALDTLDGALRGRAPLRSKGRTVRGPKEWLELFQWELEQGFWESSGQGQYLEAQLVELGHLPGRGSRRRNPPLGWDFVRAYGRETRGLVTARPAFVDPRCASEWHYASQLTPSEETPWGFKPLHRNDDAWLREEHRNQVPLGRTREWRRERNRAWRWRYYYRWVAEERAREEAAAAARAAPGKQGKPGDKGGKG